MVLNDVYVLANLFDDWPILAIPLAGLIYFLLRLLFKVNSTNAVIMALAIPGVVLALITGILDFGDSFFGFILICIFFVPSNIFGTIFFVYVIFRLLKEHFLRKPALESSNLCTAALWFFCILYIYGQWVVFINPGGS